ncbi:HD domain-containing protein [Fictibacillus sp. b24]|uniref:HD domain-containing phosphohydrolase n=1 Tax=Fictibacillus sp. b24 TaxID=3055863 RepID=UPI0025A13789|nr:HD domain-containing phosphohydrolase [Fictibacillus sp. b24]MDM5314513.1 HD domain-containing protein [Fictibacillus sp. b24]
MSFHIGKKGSTIEKVSFETFNIGLLARGDGVDIMLQTIEANEPFYVYPSDNPNVMEFFYILKGELSCELNGHKILLGPQDYYYASDLEEPVYFTAITDVEYLWVITEPTFYQLSESVTQLKDIVDQVEVKDRYTFKHSERVSLYAMQIAKKLMLPKEKFETLYIAALLHDIGKINTPTEILTKPEKLTEEEFSVIKRHPSDGAKMVKNLYYEGVAQIIEQHHERLNGSGYPKQIKGDEISLEARIIAVSDTFDAMTEDRAYRKAYDAQAAVNELIRLQESHYDKSVVDALIEILKEEKRI